MEAGWLETIIFAIIASVKFAITVPTFILSQNPALPFWQALLFGVASGTFGVVFFMVLSKYLLQFWHWMMHVLKLNLHKKPKKVFTKKSRRLVKIKTQYGLVGIAILNPVVLSIPIGTFIAVRFYKNKKKVFLYLFGGVVLWSLIFAGFGAAIKNLIHSFQVAVI